MITLKGGLVQFVGNNSPQSCVKGFGVAWADHIGSSVAWGWVRRVRDGAAGCGRLRGWSSACPQHLMFAAASPARLEFFPRKAWGSSPASSNAGCDTHHRYITVPSASRRRLSEEEEEEEEEEEGSFTGS